MRNRFDSHAVAVFLAFFGVVNALSWTISPNNLNPQSVPLAVTSPYVQAWAPLSFGSSQVSTARPRFWNGITEVRF